MAEERSNEAKKHRKVQQERISSLGPMILHCFVELKEDAFQTSRGCKLKTSVVHHVQADKTRTVPFILDLIRTHFLVFKTYHCANLQKKKTVSFMPFAHALV